MSQFPPDSWLIHDAADVSANVVFKRGENRYSCPDRTSTLYRLIALANSISPDPVYHLLGQFIGAQGFEMRLIISFQASGYLNWTDDHLLEECRAIRRRFREMLHEDAKKDAKRATTHVLRDVDQLTFTLVFPDIFTTEPYNDSKCIASWLKNEDAVPWNEAIQCVHTKNYQVVNSGSLRYAFSLRGDSDERFLVEDREALFLELMPALEHDRRGASRMRIKLRGKEGSLRLAPLFFRHIERIRLRERNGMNGVNVGVDDGLLPDNLRSLESARKHAEFKQSIVSSMSTCIDLSANEPCWSPNSGSDQKMKLLALIQADMEDRRTRYSFLNASGFLNEMIAKERAPGRNVWIKMPFYSRGVRDGCFVQKYTLEAFMKNNDMKHTYMVPDSPEERAKYLGEVKVDDKNQTYVWSDWYFLVACREVLGERFFPLRITQSVSDPDQVLFINTFQGFRCHSWMRGDQMAVSRERYESDASRIVRDKNGHRRPDNHPLASIYNKGPFAFYRDHVANLCGGDEAQSYIRHGWNALMCYYPDEKPPTVFIQSGPPGCGKSSSDEKLGEWLLNKAHVQCVTTMEALVGKFNTLGERTVFVRVEEMDMKNAKAKEMAAFQELVTCKELRGEGKGKDAGMRSDFNHYSINTNIASPAILPKDQRRIMICVFNAVVALKMASDKEYKDAYLERLAEVLDDEKMWRAYAYWLYVEFCETQEKAMSFLKTLYLKRVFNWSTIKTQLASLIYFPDTSVLGFLFLEISRYNSFSPHPAKAFVYQHDLDSKDFCNWPDWASKNARRQIEAADADDPCRRFKNHSWSDNKLEDTDRWWHKVRKQDVYERYKAALGVRNTAKFKAALLSEGDFYVELKRLLTTIDPHSEEGDRVALLEHSETFTRTRKDSEEYVVANEWLCFAPLRQLRERVVRALPAGWNFTWEAFYEQAIKK